MISLNPWIIYIFILTNLIGGLIFWIFYRKRKPIKKTEDDPPAEMMCPFMTAFKNAKKAEAEKMKQSAPKFCPVSKKTIPAKVEESKEVNPIIPTKIEKPEDVKEFYEHIPAHVKKLEQNKMMMNLKPEELEEERKIRQTQLSKIYELMDQKAELFGLSSFDDIQDQMKLYVQ